MQEIMLFLFLAALIFAGQKRKPTVTRARKEHAMKLAVCALLAALLLEPGASLGYMQRPAIILLALCMAWQMLCIALLPGEKIEKDDGR